MLLSGITPKSPLFPYTTLFRSDGELDGSWGCPAGACSRYRGPGRALPEAGLLKRGSAGRRAWRSEEHTSELQSQSNLVCRLLLEKKKLDDRSHLSESSLLVRRD